jgi:hypothetical protein
MRYFILALTLVLPGISQADNKNHIVCESERDLREILVNVSIRNEPSSSFLQTRGCVYQRLSDRLIFSRLEYFDSTNYRKGNKRRQDQDGYVFSTYEVEDVSSGVTFYTANSMYPAEHFRVLWDQECSRGEVCSYLMQTTCPRKGRGLPRVVLDDSVKEHIVLLAKCDVQNNQ